MFSTLMNFEREQYMAIKKSKIYFMKILEELALEMAILPRFTLTRPARVVGQGWGNILSPHPKAGRGWV